MIPELELRMVLLDKMPHRNQNLTTDAAWTFPLFSSFSIQDGFIAACPYFKRNVVISVQLLDTYTQDDINGICIHEKTAPP